MGIDGEDSTRATLDDSDVALEASGMTDGVEQGKVAARVSDGRPVAGVPWSHRQNAAVRALICVVSGMLSALFGTIAHRMGARYDIPYGLVVALAIVMLSTWCARSRSGVTGLALHLIFSSATAWGLALGLGGDMLTPIGFGASVPFFSAHVGYMWLFGMIVAQMVVLFLPPSWFVVKNGDSVQAGRSAKGEMQEGPSEPLETAGVSAMARNDGADEKQLGGSA
jgi:hypothetical protein